MSTIKVFCRWRPSRRPSPFFRIDHDASVVEFNIPPDVDRDAINATRGVTQKYKFDDVIDGDASQDEVFSIVAREAVDSALEGFNSTIFAYGQTGSGKTFTITGGAERYQDRGIIPRALQRVFTAVKERPSMQYRAYISYLEIYNEVGYDLLDPSAESKALEELPRVTLMEDEEGAVHLRGLSMHPVVSEEEALNLLFLGDTNRAIAETPMNMASSRSHCIFTVSLESRKDGSSVVRRSKLHLVDLAGSERVHKTNASGQLFREATHINKSLHFLELVIVALYEARKHGRLHVPYRNSMMTSVLRDSLGGNCKTTMVATINPEPEHTDESISTCRFAQRVARVTNEASVNEETDPVLIVKALKTRVTDLENELAVVRSGLGGEAPEGAAPLDLQDEDRARIAASIRRWVSEPDDVPLDLKKLPGGYAGLAHALTCLKLAVKGFGPLRAVDGSEAGGGRSAPAPPGADSTTLLTALREEVKRLKSLLAQKDTDMAALLGMGKGQGAGGASAAPTEAGGRQTGGNPASTPPPPPPQPASAFLVLANGKRISVDTLRDRDASFDVFRGMYPRTSAIEDNMALLRATYDKAKGAAERVAAAKGETTSIKGVIEKMRIARAIDAVATGAATDREAAVARLEPDEAERGLLARLEGEKAGYRSAFTELRELKAEIERIQQTLEQGRLKMQADFESWYAACTSQLAKAAASGAGVGGATQAPGLPRLLSQGEPLLHPSPAPHVDRSLNSSTVSTGSAATDADIAAFYRAKEELAALKRSGLLRGGGGGAAGPAAGPALSAQV